MSPGAYAKGQTALFYFYTCKELAKTVSKVDEITSPESNAYRASYYSALALQGHALINLQRTEDAARSLENLLDLIRIHPSGLPYGDELNFLQAAIQEPTLSTQCRTILTLIIPKMRSQEYVEKAKDLLQ